MGQRAERMALGKQRAREARVQRLVDRRAHEDRVAEALHQVGEAYPNSREARAVWLQLEQAVGQALLQLTAERLLLSEVAARTGLPAGECRRLMRVARASFATEETENDRC